MLSCGLGPKVEATHIENPRDEEHEMEIENDRYMHLIDEQATTWREGAHDVLELLTRYEVRITDHARRGSPTTRTGSSPLSSGTNRSRRSSMSRPAPRLLAE